MKRLTNIWSSTASIIQTETEVGDAGIPEAADGRSRTPEDDGEGKDQKRRNGGGKEK